ncbi:MAG: SGNH/GDSL hydrolase family protein [Phycisphaerales bacterium]
MRTNRELASRALWFGCAAGALVAAGSARAQTTGDLRGFFQRAGQGRADIVCIGDSNQLYDNFGWEAGLLIAYSARFPIYSTGLLSPGEAGGGGGTCGHTWFGFGAGTQSGFRYAGAPAELEGYLNSNQSELFPMNYQYVAAGTSVQGTATHGIFIDRESLLDTSGPLRFEVVYGVFPGSGSGSFTPSVRLSAPTFQYIASSPTVFTRGDAWGVAVNRDLVLPAGARASRLEFRFTPPFDSINGPFLAYWMRLENTSRQTGLSLNTLYGFGGRSSRDMAATMLATSDQALSLYFQRVRALSSGAVLVRIAAGLNDDTELLPSVGPAAVQLGSSPEAYRDNLFALMSRIEEVWALNGWPASDLWFQLVPPHPVGATDPTLYVQYRGVASTLAAERSRTGVVDFSLLTSHAELLANNWYHLPNDTAHFTNAGYTELGLREVAVLLDGSPICPPDVDGSGGVDGDDIIEFFRRWDQNDLDYNGDGGTDSDDVIAFFTDWDAGC